jgi:hypothetical protein
MYIVWHHVFTRICRYTLQVISSKEVLYNQQLEPPPLSRYAPVQCSMLAPLIWLFYSAVLVVFKCAVFVKFLSHFTLAKGAHHKHIHCTKAPRITNIVTGITDKVWIMYPIWIKYFLHTPVLYLYISIYTRCILKVSSTHFLLHIFSARVGNSDTIQFIVPRINIFSQKATLSPTSKLLNRLV